jgi:hypothetical protein
MVFIMWSKVKYGNHLYKEPKVIPLRSQPSRRSACTPNSQSLHLYYATSYLLPAPDHTSPPQKNLHQINTNINSPSPANGPYCFNSNSQLILTAACRYFLLSSFKRLLISPILSRLSPLYSKSSIFFVITFVTSLSSSFSLSKFCVARLSLYVAFVLLINVSNSMNAYGRRIVLMTCCEGYVLLNSVQMSERYVKASLRG